MTRDYARSESGVSGGLEFDGFAGDAEVFDDLFGVPEVGDDGGDSGVLQGPGVGLEWGLEIAWDDFFDLGDAPVGDGLEAFVVGGDGVGDLHGDDAEVAGGGFADCGIDISTVDDVVGDHGHVVVAEGGGFAEDAGGVVVGGDAEEADFALLFEPGDDFEDFGAVELLGGAGAMGAHEDIDMIGSESFEAAFEAFDDVAGEGGVGFDLGSEVGHHGDAEVGGEVGFVLAGVVGDVVAGCVDAAVGDDFVGALTVVILPVGGKVVEDFAVFAFAELGEAGGLGGEEDLIAAAGDEFAVGAFGVAVVVGGGHVEVVEAELEGVFEVLVVVECDGVAAADDFGDHESGAAEASIGHVGLLVAPFDGGDFLGVVGRVGGGGGS